MSFWLFKQEPSAYSYSDLEKDSRTVWDGVSNNLALKHLRNVRKGDKIMFYHSGEEKQIVGLMEALSDAYPDPKSTNKSSAVVDVGPLKRLDVPVSLKRIKADQRFAAWELVRMSRLSVMPVPKTLWDMVLVLSNRQ
jgi:predicted RNA-binding protein with PUA-like domain